MARLTIYDVRSEEADAYPTLAQARGRVRLLARRRGALEVEVTDEGGGTTMVLTRASRQGSPYRVRHVREPGRGRPQRSLAAAIQACGLNP